MRSLESLALFGAAPAFDRPLHVAQLNVPDWRKFEDAVRGIFHRHYFSNNGPLVQRLDQVFAERLRVEHAISVTNGTVALMMLARALELKGEVIVPAFTFPATAQALYWAGLEPVLCDVSPRTHMITPALVAPLVSERTAGILGVHLWGRPCAPDELGQFANDKQLTLLFDACHSVGCTFGPRPIGNFGAAEAFSFHATKIVNGAEGGCITTNDGALAARLRTMRNFSETLAPVPTRINGKMSEIQAALALVSLEELPRNIAINKAHYDMYAAGLTDVPGVELIEYSPEDANNFQYVIIEIDEARAGLHRDVIWQLLTAENVLAQRYFYPGLHRVAPFICDGRLFPGTERICSRILLLPTGSGVSTADVERICELVRSVVAMADSIRGRAEARQ